MYTIGNYKDTDLMGDLICGNYTMLLVMTRFGIKLGFGDKTIAKVCEENNVDTKTFLAVVNLLINDDKENLDLSIHALITYLKNSHSYFLDFKLPSIREELVEALGNTNNDIALAIIVYYDEYVAEVRKHMLYEEETVFPYVDALIKKTDFKKYNINIFSKKHDHVEAKLTELKNIIIKYYPAASSNEINTVLFDIFSCSHDLASHNEVEDKLFVPVIKEMESNLNNN